MRRFQDEPSVSNPWIFRAQKKVAYEWRPEAILCRAHSLAAGAGARGSRVGGAAFFAPAVFKIASIAATGGVVMQSSQQDCGFEEGRAVRRTFVSFPSLWDAFEVLAEDENYG